MPTRSLRLIAPLCRSKIDLLHSFSAAKIYRRWIARGLRQCGVARGAYVLASPAQGKPPQVILVGTGSELPICVEAYEKLVAEGIAAQLVSMPSWELFEAQDEAYKREVFPPNVPARVAVEAGLRFGWDRYIGVQGKFVGMASFGASAPFERLYDEFGIHVAGVCAAAKSAISEGKTV